MRPKKSILLYCADPRVALCYSVRPCLKFYDVTAIDDRRGAAAVMMASDLVCGVLIHAKQGDFAGRLIHRLLEADLHIPVLLVDRAGDLAPVRYADLVLYGRNTPMAHILGALNVLCAEARNPVYLSVCSGIEAVSVAWESFGWQPAVFAEIDPFCCWLLRSRYGASRPLHMPSPNDAPTRKEAKQRAAALRNVVALPQQRAVPNYGDFTKIRVADVGTIDLLAGGTPCQSFSVAGKRVGLEDAITFEEQEK